jgi:SAM-dependent methyltransferase
MESYLLSLLRQTYRAYLSMASPSTRLIKRGLSQLKRRHLSEDTFDLCLDIGGGTSPYRAIFPARRFISLDIAARDTTTIVGDITSLPVGEASVDLVMCTEVLEHIANTGAALSELYRVLRPGGHLVVTVPLLYGEHGVADYYRWTRAGLSTALEGAGMDVVEVASRGGYFSAMGVMLGLIPDLIVAPPNEDWTATDRPNVLGRMAARFAMSVPLHVAAFGLSLMDSLDRERKHSPGLVALARK